jgi:hypothetical protein
MVFHLTNRLPARLAAQPALGGRVSLVFIRLLLSVVTDYLWISAEFLILFLPPK